MSFLSAVNSAFLLLFYSPCGTAIVLYIGHHMQLDHTAVGDPYMCHLLCSLGPLMLRKLSCALPVAEKLTYAPVFHSFIMLLPWGKNICMLEMVMIGLVPVSFV